MKRNGYLISLLLIVLIGGPVQAGAQPPRIKDIFPEGTVMEKNLSYANDSNKKHLLDIYLPPGKKVRRPLIVWIHGGAWMLNDKYADMGYMKNTVRGFIDSGFAVASIDYRYSTEAIFPAQIQDCNQALAYLDQHAEDYKFDRDRIALIGFSAGGHLASLLALSNNNAVRDFFPAGKQTHFKIKCVLDFYGPSDFIMLASIPDTSISNERNPVSLLLGATPLSRPDLAKKASPVTYIDRNDPPFLIVQGEKDESVPNTQSKILSSWLTVSGVKNELIVVPNAPHYGDMFDVAEIRSRLFRFLDFYLK